LLATTGAAFLVTADHFVSFFLALEILSVALYGMIAFTASANAPSRRASNLRCGSW